VPLAAVLEVILSTLDRDLIPATPPAPTLPPLPTTAAAAAGSSSSSQLSSAEQSALLEAVGRYPAGHAPAAACSEELREAYRVLQVSCSCYIVVILLKQCHIATAKYYVCCMPFYNHGSKLGHLQACRLNSEQRTNAVLYSWRQRSELRMPLELCRS
jgi:hypothetical protein